MPYKPDWREYMLVNSLNEDVIACAIRCECGQLAWQDRMLVKIKNIRYRYPIIIYLCSFRTVGYENKKVIK